MINGSQIHLAFITYQLAFPPLPSIGWRAEYHLCALPTSGAHRLCKPLGPWPEAISDRFVRNLEVGLADDVASDLRLSHSGASALGLLSREGSGPPAYYRLLGRHGARVTHPR